MSSVGDLGKVKRVETDVVKCKSCGGTMVFDPATQSLKCEHCGNTEVLSRDTNVLERDILEGFEKAARFDRGEQASFKCSNCGAVVMLGADESAAVCPFCSTPIIVKEEYFGGLKPQVILPFKFSADAASDFAKRWAKRRLFAPRKFKKTLSPENMHGVYEPAFTFDSKTRSTYRGRVGDRHTRVVGSGKNRHTETYIVYRNVSGTYDKFFDDVLVANNSNFDQKKLSSLLPFALNEQCVYEKKFLSGYMSEVYQKDVKDGWTDAKKIIDANLYSAIKSTLHCDVVDYLDISTEHSDVKYKYILLPVYFSNYRYNKKDYNLMINGSNGKTSGKTPISPWRVLFAVLIGVALLALLIYLYSFAE